VSSTDDRGVVDAKTRLYFAQKGSRVFARYGRGSVTRGCLVGTLSGSELGFRYTQLEDSGQIHGGRSICEVQRTAQTGFRVIDTLPGAPAAEVALTSSMRSAEPFFRSLLGGRARQNISRCHSLACFPGSRPKLSQAPIVSSASANPALLNSISAAPAIRQSSSPSISGRSRPLRPELRLDGDPFATDAAQSSVPVGSV
jgi:hypothetical protein